MTTKSIQKHLLLTVVFFILLSIGLTFFPLPVMLYGTQLMFVLMAILYAKKKERSIKKHLRLHSAPLRAFLLMALVMVLYVPVASFLTLIPITFLNELGFKYMDPGVPSMDYPTILSFIMFSLTPGICEELFFRGHLLSSYERPLSRSQALIWSGFFFGIIHLTPYNLLSPWVMGMIFGLFVFKYNSVFPAIFGHALFNSSVLLVEKLDTFIDLDGHEVADPTVMGIGDLIEVIPVALIAAALIFLLLRKGKFFSPLKVITPELKVIEVPVSREVEEYAHLEGIESEIYKKDVPDVTFDEKPGGRRPLGKFFILSVIILLILLVLFYIPTQLDMPDVELVTTLLRI